MATSAGELIYTVGMDTKGLLAGAQQVESSLTKVVESSKKIDTAQTKASQAVSRFIEALKLEAATVSMSAQQKELYVAVLNGATSAQQDEIRAIQSAISKENEAIAIKNKLIAARVEADAKMKASQEATLRYIEALKTEAAMVNMSAKERELYIASLNGATSAQLKQISAIRDAITAEKSIASSRADAKARLDAQIESLRLEATTAAMSAREKELYVAALNGATAAQQREISSLRDKITASRQATAAQANGIAALRGYNNVLNNAAGSNNRFRGGVQQAGYQIQDLVVQLQMGTSAFMAIGQQGSQLAGAFGPGGAVIGAVIALGSALLGLAYNASQATADLTELAAAGDRIANLRLDTLVKINDASRDLTSPDRISKYKQLGGQILELTTAYENQQLVTKRLRDEAQKAQDALQDVGGFFGKSQADATAELAAKNQELNESLRQESDIRSRVNGIQKQQQDLYDEEAKLKKEDEKQTRSSTVAVKDNSAAIAARNEKLKQRAEIERKRNEERKAAEEASRKEKIVTEFETVESSTFTAGESVDAKYQADLKALKDYHKLAGAENSRYEKSKARLERQYEKYKRQAIEDDYKAQSEGHAFVMDSLDALGNASTNAISGLLSGTMSVTEAMQSFANIILNQAVGALVEIGIQQVKNQILGQTAAAASVAAASAQGTALAAAYAPAAISANIATFGAAGTAGLAGYQAALSSGALLAVAGARQFGGPTDAGGIYRLGENNQPEVWKTSAGMFGISGDRGSVTPLSDMQGGGFQQSVSVHNYGSGQVSTRTSPDGKQMDVIINEIASQVENRRGRFARAMTSGTNTKFKAR